MCPRFDQWRREQILALRHTGLMTEQEYREVALGDAGGRWELVRGQLREKRDMSAAHGDVIDELATQLRQHLDRSEFRVRTHQARLRISPDSYFAPDVAILPAAIVRAKRADPHALDAYAEPLPLVVEVWSPSTGDSDLEIKIPDNQRRGDLEIWFIHPFARTLTAWRRRSDGSYSETIFHGGTVRLGSLPGVAIDLDAVLEP
jgi:Uma2 family endonuclease